MTGGLRAGARPLGNLSGVLDMALAQWDGRDDTQPQPERRRAANEAVTAIDDMLAVLHRVRGQLVAEVRAADDANAARVDEMLAEYRRRDAERGGAEAAE